MSEFFAKKKVLTLNIGDQKIPFNKPTLAQIEALDARLVETPASQAVRVYNEFFVSLGLPEGVIGQLDEEDFMEFITFALRPKKKESVTPQ